MSLRNVSCHRQSSCQLALGRLHIWPSPRLGEWPWSMKAQHFPVFILPLPQDTHTSLIDEEGKEGEGRWARGELRSLGCPTPVFFPPACCLTFPPAPCNNAHQEKLLGEGSAKSSISCPSGPCPSRKGSPISSGRGVVSSPASGASSHLGPCSAAFSEPQEGVGSSVSPRVQTEPHFFKTISLVWPEIYSGPSVGVGNGSPKTSSEGLSCGNLKGGTDFPDTSWAQTVTSASATVSGFLED